MVGQNYSPAWPPPCGSCLAFAYGADDSLRRKHPFIMDSFDNFTDELRACHRRYTDSILFTSPNLHDLHCNLHFHRHSYYC